MEKIRTGTGGLTEAEEMPLEWIHLKRCLAYDLQEADKLGRCKLTPAELSKRFNDLIERTDADEVLSNPDLWEPLGAGEKGAIGNVYFLKGNKKFMVKSMGEEGMSDAENSIVHAALAAALELDTPGIEVRVLINEQTGLIDKVYYVMRRVEGTRLDKKTAAEIFLVRDQLAKHRALAQWINDYDRKIDNYFITPDGRVYALDAGCADVTGARATSFGGLDDAMFNEGAYGRDHWLSRSYKDEICGKDAAGQPLFEKAPKIEVWEPHEEFCRKNLVAEEALTYNDAQSTIDAIHELVADEPKLPKILDDALRKIHGTEREIEVKRPEPTKSGPALVPPALVAGRRTDREGRFPLHPQPHATAEGRMKRFLTLLLIVPAIVCADDPDAVCRTHLKHLGGAVKAYQLTHDDKLPAKLSDLYLDGLVESHTDFVCPSSGTTITTTGEIDAKSDYVLATGNVLVQEKADHHLAAYANGSIKPTGGAVTTTDSGPATPPPITGTADDSSDFSLIPPGTVIPPQQPPPPPAGTRPAAGRLSRRGLERRPELRPRRVRCGRGERRPGGVGRTQARRLDPCVER